MKSIAAYARINTNAVFTRPNHPLPNVTQFHISDAISLHKETIVTLNLYNLVKRTIIQKINAAVDYEFLTYFINDEIGLLAGNIPDILASLFETYSNIMSQAITANKSTVKSIPYNHINPLATIFHAINEYYTIDKASVAPATPD